MSNDRRSEIETFIANILGGIAQESPLPKAPTTPESAKDDGLNEDNPYEMCEYFMFYVLTTPKGPVLGNTMFGTRTPICAKNFDSLRKSIVDEYMNDTGATGLSKDDLTIITITKLS